jgi:hypothetical protein
MSELSVFESAKQDYEKEIYDLKQEIEYLRSVGSLCILDKKCKELQNINEKQKEVLDKIKEYITSYESINTIQECEIPENNIGLNEETFIEMVNRYMKVHDKILELLEEIE